MEALDAWIAGDIDRTLTIWDDIVASHPMPADDDVDLGVLQHVAHVEGAGHVGGRDYEREDTAARLGGGAKDSLVDPPVRPVRLKPLWFVDLVELHGGII